MLPRDLADLQTHYQSLVDGVAAGSLSYEDAIEALAHIAATDANGMVWRLDINGNFLSGSVGSEAVLADPNRFVERTSPGPWDQGIGPVQSSQGYGDRSISTSSADDKHFSSSNQTNPGFDFGVVPGQGHIDNPQPKDKGERRRPSLRLPSVPDFSGGIVQTLKRYRTLIIVGFAALGAALIWGSSSPSTPATELPVTSSIEETAGVSTSGPVTDEKEKGSSELLVVANQLLTQIGGGNADTAPSIIGDPGEGNRALLRRAQFAGYAAVGLVLRATAVTSSDDTNATITVSLLNKSGDVVANGKVDLIQTESGWLLKAWPQLG